MVLVLGVGGNRETIGGEASGYGDKEARRAFVCNSQGFCLDRE